MERAHRAKGKGGYPNRPRCTHVGQGRLGITAPTSKAPKRNAAFAHSVGRRPRNVSERTAQVTSAVVGSMIVFTAETRFAGNPPIRACSRTIASFGAM
jgi:hypothetical protein